MKNAILTIAALSTVALSACTLIAQSTYTFTSFDVPFANASNTKAFEINARGDIVGRFVDSAMGIPRGFHRYNDGTYAPPIDVPVTNTGTVARGINSSGDIAGKYFDPTFPSQTHGFVLTAGGKFTSFDVNVVGTIPGSTIANAINNVGQIVGNYGTFGSTAGCGLTGHGYLRNTNGSFTPIDFPAGSVIATFAQGIDDAGNIVGTYITAPAPPTACSLNALVTAHGYLRDAKGNFTTIDAPSWTGAMETIVNRISDAGDVIGVYTTAQSTLGVLLGDTPVPPGIGAYFVLSNSGVFTSIPSPFGSNAGRQGPLGINPRGDLVGVYTGGTGDHGFIATK